MAALRILATEDVAPAVALSTASLVVLVSFVLLKLQLGESLQDLCYPMSARHLGHALIVNNVAQSQPGSVADVRALEETYTQMGFRLRVEKDLSQQVRSRSCSSWGKSDDWRGQGSHTVQKWFL